MWLRGLAVDSNAMVAATEGSVLQSKLDPREAVMDKASVGLSWHSTGDGRTCSHHVSLGLDADSNGDVLTVTFEIVIDAR